MLNQFAIIRWIKAILPFWLRIFIIELFVIFQKIIYIKLHFNTINYNKDKKIFLLLSTDYSNLGDIALSYAQKVFLKKYFPDYKIIEITVNETLKSLYSIKKSCSEEDIITLKGGGNVGIEYFREELIRREIIKYFPNNKIIMFPQTVYFPNTKFGNLQFRKTVEIFNSNKNFYPFFRDKKSYSIMKRHLNKCYLSPDIVLSLNLKDNYDYISESKGIICLRNDVEGIYNENDKILIKNALCHYYDSIYITDTIKTYKIPIEKREKELKDLLWKFSSAKCIITDRLHGMIFAALLGIPCIVLQNYNHKLLGQYEWLKEFKYIKYIQLNKENLIKALEEIKTLSIIKIPDNYYEKDFNKIIEVLRLPLYSSK